MNLLELQHRFSSEERCRAFFRNIRWPNGVACPRCGTRAPYYTASYDKWECRDCRYQFTLTSQTIFHGTRTPLQKWFVAIWLVHSSKRGVSAKQLERTLGVTYKTAWRIGMQIRLAMLHGSFEEKLCAVLVSRRDSSARRPMWGRTGRGLLIRNSLLVQTSLAGGRSPLVVGDLRAHELAPLLSDTMRLGAELRLADQLGGGRLSVRDGDRQHRPIQPLTFVSGCVAGCGSESAGSLLKRAVLGVYHRISTKYLAAYVGEFAFRFSHRRDERLFENVLKYCSASAAP
jgi:transposase-like protein